MQQEETDRSTLEMRRAAVIQEKVAVDEGLREVRAAVKEAQRRFRNTGKPAPRRWFNARQREINEKAKRSQELQVELSRLNLKIKSINRGIAGQEALLWKIARAVDQGDVNVFDLLVELDALAPGWRE